ncbi:hypothetical protein CLV98_101140 [Dyadobacter jejuensis]|uniref:Uncharacterized protein n=1 Tax=Dyadobacter jejuensis TaxID=1082580 RepID=A0A316AQF2_9BACT|nr:hypothetical protein CLV98_101140 [Dyadobacter jejuensis]
MRERPLHEKITDLASVLMALTYAGGGIYLISSSLSFSLMPVGSVTRYAFAGILILYGLLRGFRIWKKWRD